MIRRKNDNCPACVVDQAQNLINEFRQGRRDKVKRLAIGYLSIAIGRCWRLLSKNDGQQWTLLTHERYNKEYKK